MKKILPIVLLVVLLGTSGFLLYKRQHKTDTGPKQTTAIVKVLSSDVQVKNQSGEFKSILGEVEVAVGTEIKTSSTGRAQLIYPNGTVTTITEDSDIKINLLDKEGSQSQIDIVVGGVWSKVKSILGTGEYYQVETDNIVASVRGTIFAAEYRNNKTTVYGVEHTIRVQARNKALQKIIDKSSVDISTGEITEFQGSMTDANAHALAKRNYNDSDFQKTFIKNQVLESVDKNDISEQPVRDFMRKIHDNNSKDKVFLNRMEDKLQMHLDASTSPSPTPTVNPKVSVTTTPNPTATTSPVATPTPSPTQTPAMTTPIFQSVVPTTVTAGQNFSLNGQNFTTGRNVKQFTTVYVGSTPVTITYFDSLTIFADTTGLKPGTYSVTLVTTSGDRLTLPNSLTVQ